VTTWDAVPQAGKELVDDHIYVSNLSYETTESDLRNMFEHMARWTKVSIVMEPHEWP